MFLFKFFRSLGAKLNYQLFSANNRPANEDDYDKEVDRSILGPVRTFENIDTAAKSIIQLRSPLDMLVSQYYSFGFTHVVPPLSLLQIPI